jgi:hypothetical protein
MARPAEPAPAGLPAMGDPAPDFALPADSPEC